MAKAKFERSKPHCNIGIAAQYQYSRECKRDWCNMFLLLLCVEIGEYTDEAISVSSDKYQYIVKRVELKENAYNDDKYLELFEGYEDTVMYEKYEAYIETFFEGVVINEAVASEYSIVDTFLSKYADDYYTQYLYYYYGIGQ